jgi:allophanate hydrolase subunit 2
VPLLLARCRCLPGASPSCYWPTARLPAATPRLAQVISADLGRLAQALPGTRLRFQRTTLAEAQAQYLAQEQQLRVLARAVYLKSLR